MHMAKADLPEMPIYYKAINNHSQVYFSDIQLPYVQSHSFSVTHLLIRCYALNINLEP